MSNTTRARGVKNDKSKSLDDTTKTSQSQIIEQFKNAALAHEVIIPDKPDISNSESMPRCATVGKESGKDGAYRLHLDASIPYGGFQNHRNGDGWHDWRYNPGRELTTAELTELEEKQKIQRELRTAELERQYSEAAKKANKEG